MERRLLAMALAAMMVVVSLGGCYSMGKATGQAADQVEESADNFKDGYNDGKTE